MTSTAQTSRAAAALREVLGWGIRRVPPVRWGATRSRWELRLDTLVVLVVGQWVFGTGEALLVDAGLGNSPWTVLAQGISLHSPLSIGAATLVVSALVLLGWKPLHERLGLGTVANAIVIALAIDVMLPLLPSPEAIVMQLLQVVAGIVAIGLGSTFYLTANLGPGPRDGLMVGLARVLRRPIPLVRLFLELSVLVIGWALGGVAGVGTLLFALLIGHTVGIFLDLSERWFGRDDAAV